MKIDFVITWVDGNDPEWIQQYNHYCPSEKKLSDTREIRYRDSGLLKYWFRGVEKNASWVNKIYFVTFGHIPSWLNTKCDKLIVVNHSDYIPKKYLPVFSSHPIEFFMHKIPELSENFVYFNDDMFLIDKINQNFFFDKNGYPKETIALSALSKGEIEHIRLNNILEINRTYSKKRVIKKYKKQWYSLKNGKQVIRTLCLDKLFNDFTGIYDSHLPQPYLKSSFEKAWILYKDSIEKTVQNKFRSQMDVNHWIIKNYQICEGLCSPTDLSKTGFYGRIKNDTDKISLIIREKQKKVIVVNDEECDNYDIKIETIKNAFESIFPSKSIYEI